MIQEADFFRASNTTILVNEMACLKRCEELLQDMRNKGRQLFRDPEFGPQFKGDIAVDSIYFGDPPPGYPDPKKFIWVRPDVISPNVRPQFLDDGAETNDVMQGAIGDCWFIGALSVLAT